MSEEGTHLRRRLRLVDDVQKGLLVVRTDEERQTAAELEKRLEDLLESLQEKLPR